MDADWDAAVGSVAQETARLLEALGLPAREPGDDAPPGRARDEGARDDHGHVPMGSAQSCTWCPVCRGVTYLRELSPETLRSLAEVAALAASTLTDLASRRADRGDRADRAEPPAPGTAAGRTRPRAATVEEVVVVAESTTTSTGGTS